MSDAIANDQVVEDEAPEVEPEDLDNEPDEEPEEPESGFDPDKAREKIRKVNSENRNLRKRATDAEKQAEAAKDAGTRVTALEAENMRLKVAVKLGGQLPDDLIERLRGSSEEELLEDAEKLLGYFEQRKPPTNQPREKLRGGGDPTHEPSLIDSDPDQFAERIFKN